MSRLFPLFGILFVLACSPAWARPEIGLPQPSQNASISEAGAPMDVSPEMEARARAIGKKLRCVVCQNQSIDESDATLAADMRSLVLERLQAGDSDEQVIEYIRQRYGDFVLMKPPVKRDTWALWFGPLGFLLIGALVFWGVSRKRQKATGSVPKEDDEAIAEILKRYGD